MEIDYEALGRYTAAQDQVKSLLSRQGDLTNKIERLLRHCANDGSFGDVVYLVDTPTIAVLSTELNQVHTSLITAVKDVNFYADKAGKSKIRLID